jgi:hypothetical protein
LDVKLLVHHVTSSLQMVKAKKFLNTQNGKSRYKGLKCGFI